MHTGFTRNIGLIHALSAYVISIVFVCCPADAVASDPFDTLTFVATSPAEGRVPALRAICQKVPSDRILALIDVVEQALCNSPQTRLAWINARAQAAQLGIAQSAYLPNLTANASRSRNDTSTPQPRFNQTAAGLSINYLLYDFGGRDATLENARQLMAALAATQDATLQSVFLSAVQAYYQRYAAAAAVAAARDSLRASEESLQAAETRLRIGANTPADRLQAQTATSQAKLVLIQAEANAQTTIGVLANIMGLDANASPAIAEPTESMALADFERNIGELVTAAKQSRPDLAAAEAQVKAAQANIRSVNALGMPSVSLFASHNYSDGGLSDALRSNAVGVTVTVPLFTGFSNTYRQRVAEAQLETKVEQYEQLSKQVALDVWRAYYALQSGTASVRASADLVASAEASEKMTAGRYKAGYGGILDLLNAQSALASARQQQIQAQFNWRIAKAALAQALGKLDFSQFQPSGKQ